MMKKLPWVLLAISIIFNFTFAGGFLQARSASQVAEIPESRQKLVADQFHLNRDQQQAFVELRGQMQDRVKELREAIVLARQELWAAMSTHRPDRQRIREIQDRLSELYRERRELSSQHFRRFLGVLTDEQRKAVLEKIRARERGRRGHRKLVDRFDANGDGKLDDAERAKAREYLRRSARRRHRPGDGTSGGGPAPRTGGRRGRKGTTTRGSGELPGWMRKRFDADGDGKLTDEERARAMKALSSRGGPRHLGDWARKRFDADGDGKLSSEERAAALRAMREQTNKNEDGAEP